jgi:hypothetical protein
VLTLAKAASTATTNIPAAFHQVASFNFDAPSARLSGHTPRLMWRR